MRMVFGFPLALAAILAVSATSLTPLPAGAADMDEAKIERVLEKLLKERPELVVEALEAFKANQEAAEAQRQKEQLAANTDALFANPGDPIMGNPNGSVTLVEFFDYRCGYCKRSLTDVIALTEANKDLKVVFKEFPILGEQSVLASRVSLAVQLVSPDLYADFHKLAMASRTNLSEAVLMDMVRQVGGDPGVVRVRMNDAAVTEAIGRNYQLAEQLGIRGTPAFVIGDQIIPGAVGRAQLNRLIDEQRG